jgi:hypothetical protein
MGKKLFPEETKRILGVVVEFFQPVFPFQLPDHSSSPRPIYTRKELMPTKSNYYEKINNF